MNQNLNLLLFLILPGFLFAGWPGKSCVAWAQGSNVADSELEAATKEFQQAIQDWRIVTKQAVTARLSFEDGTREESETHRQEWEAAVEEGERQRTVVEQTAVRLMRLSKSPPEELVDLLTQIHGSAIARGRWHKADEIAQVLRPAKQNDEPFQARDAIGKICSNQFEEAQKFMAQYGTIVSDMPAKPQELFTQLPELMAKFDREKKFLEKDAQGEPLPRVALKTSRGKIEIELFEDQAPDTVGNFIFLVENGYYTNLIFHRVINDFMAQTGGVGLDKLTREPPYSIFDEQNTPDARHHFQAYVSMATAGIPDTGSSQFFILFCPAPSLDGKHTVFGRVISGFDVLESINRTHRIKDNGDEEELPDLTPDHIISASVIRKRNHEYKPRKVQ